MAERAVTLLINKLETLLAQEVKLSKRVHREVQYIRDEFQSMQRFLRDADARSEEDVKTWVKEVRDAAYDTEDVLDEYTLRIEQQQQHEMPQQYGNFSCLHNLIFFIKNLKAQHQMTIPIHHIKAKVHEVSKRSHGYRLKNSLEQDSSSKFSAHDAHLFEEVDLVGIDKPMENLIALLLGLESRLGVVSVVGMGGLGKTALVKKVFDDQKVKRYFQHHAWITVSQSFKIEELLRHMIEQLFKESNQPFPRGLYSMKDDQLKAILKEFLQEKRYVIALDDVRNLQAWEAIKNALPDSNCGSRIIMTTRFADLASSCCKQSQGDYIYYLKPLTLEDSLTLFCKKAFGNNSCPPEVKEISHTLLRRCEGLPLAIVAIGVFLLTKDKIEIEKWESIYHALGSESIKGNKLNSLKRILSLSYSDLPSYLKSCFLYLSIFPEDYLIECSRLTRLWTAEGFLQEETGKTIKEVGESYLCELINRGLMQIGETTIDGRIKTCRVHDLVHEIILSKSNEENFLTGVAEKNREVHEKSRRLSISTSGCDNVVEGKNFSHLRSLFVFDIDALSIPSMHALFCGFRLLKVLDMKDAPLERFPDELTNLFHLRYLSLRRTKIKKLPSTIGKLQNLETLDLKGTDVSELPSEISKLQRLHNLLVYRNVREESDLPFHATHGFKVQAGIWRLVFLQKLCFIQAGGGMMREIGIMRQLKRLGIVGLRREDGNYLCISIGMMRNLCSLNITSMNDEEFIDLQFLSSPPPLQRLYLKGRLEKLPGWISSLHDLRVLRLRWSRLEEEPLGTIQALPNLVELELTWAYDGKELCFRAGGFQKLKYLVVDNLENLRSVIIEEGAMPQLERLYVNRCPAFTDAPLERLTNLKLIHFRDVPDNLGHC